jgi:Ca2+-binding RTX toxin-like protein
VEQGPASSAEVPANILPESIPLNQIPVYHSLPGATKKIYLDFDGETITGTPWNSFNQSNPIRSVPFDTDGNINDFSTSEQTAIFQTWQRVAEDFAPFQVDVTTEAPSAQELAAGSTALRVMISTDVDDTRLGGTGYRWYSNAGGVAYVGSWSWSNAVVWVFYNNLARNEKYMAEAASHEAGHALGLGHDGRTSPSESYYGGHGSGSTGWASIMGVGYYQNLSQWSKGEYVNANNTQDDLAIINQRLPYRADEDGSSPANPQLLVNATVNVSSVISTRTDIDVFSFEATAGQVNLSIDPWVRGPNLDILAELYNVEGELVASNNPVDALYADLSYTITTPGTYYLHVDGVGKGTWATNGYNDYGSLGQFTVTGTIPLASTAVSAPSNLAVAETSDSQLDLTWTDNSGNETFFEVQRSLDGNTWSTVATLPPNSTSHADTGLNSATRYYYRVGAGNSTSQSPFTSTVNAITQGLPPSPPENLSGTPQVGGTQINLTWTDPSTNETSFTLQRSTNGTSWTTIATLGPNTTSYNSIGLVPLTTYFFRISATNLRGTSAYSSVAEVTTLEGAPAAPTEFFATLASLQSGQLQWIDNATNEDDFLLERFVYSQGGGGQSQWQVIATLQPNTTSYTDNTLTPGIYVQYRLTARNRHGVSSQVYTSVSVPEAPPSQVVATATSPTQINLVWLDNSQFESGFTLQRSLNGTIWSTVANLPANTTSYSDSGLTEQTTYSYRLSLTSQGTTGEGGLVFYSNIATATTPAANGQPYFTSNPTFTAIENQTSVGTVTAADPNPNQTLSFLIDGGADAAHFTLDAATGSLAFLSPPDFEVPTDANSDNEYEITVRVNDGAGGSATQAVLVSVTNRVELTGTSGNDSFTITPTANPGEVTISRGSVVLGTFATAHISLDGGAGNDLVTLHGTAGADTFEVAPNQFSWLSGGIAFHLTSLESQTINAQGGDDTVYDAGGTATFNGAANNDTVIARSQPNTFDLTAGGGGFLNGTLRYQNSERLVGGASDDTFRFTNAGNVSLGIDAGDGNDLLDYSLRTSGSTFNLATGKFTSAGTVTGVEQIIGSTGNDTLTGPATGAVWNLTAANRGNVAGTTFEQIEILAGGSGNDTFLPVAGGSVSGSISGGSGVDVLDLTQQVNPAIVNFAVNTASGVGKFAGLEQFVGSGPTATAIGGNGSNGWKITGVNSSLLGSTQLNGFGELVGGSGNDTFTIQPGGALSGQIQGGGGINTVSAPNAPNDWTLTETGGDVAGISFSGMQVFTGNAAADTFRLIGNAAATRITGGSGNDTLDFTYATPNVEVNLQLLSATRVAAFSSIEAVQGSSGNDHLLGSNTSSTFTLSGLDSGTARTTAFSSFENLTGGSGNDTFLISPGGSSSGVLSGGSGVNLLDYRLQTSGVEVDLLSNTASHTGGATNMQVVRGGSGNDLLAGGDGPDLLLGGGGADTLFGRAGHDTLFGGVGNDTLNGEQGRDWLVGGSGVDSLSGNDGEDILIGGRADAFHNESSLSYQWSPIQAVLAEWTRDDATPFATRVTNLQLGGGLNGTQLLKSQSDGNTTLDTVLGNLDLDWFLVSASETLADFDVANEVRTNV